MVWMKRKTFGLTTTCMDFFSLDNVSTQIMKLLFQHEFFIRELRQGFQHWDSLKTTGHLSTLESSIPASDTSTT